MANRLAAKTPNTDDPLPDMRTPSASSHRNCSFSIPMPGYLAIVAVSRSLKSISLSLAKLPREDVMLVFTLGFVNFGRQCRYTQAVDTGNPGYKITNQKWGNFARGVKRSPIPRARAGRRRMKKGTSVPSERPSFSNLLIEYPKRNSRFRAIKVAAASLLPPPNPAPTGIFLRIWIETGWSIPAVFMIRSAAPKTRFFLPAGTRGWLQVTFMGDALGLIRMRAALSL